MSLHAIMDFKLVISTKLPPILHRFRDKAVDIGPKSLYTWLPLLCLTAPVEGFPWDDLLEIFSGCQRMAKVPNAVEILRKIFNRLSRAHERYRRQTDRQTDGRQQIANVNMSSRSLINQNIQ